MKQSKGMTSKVVVKVLKRQVLRVEEKKIKDVLNMLIQVLSFSAAGLEVDQAKISVVTPRNIP